MTEYPLAYVSTAEFNKNCQFIRKHKDFLLGDCSLYKDKVHKITMLCKQRTLKDNTELEQQIRYCSLLTNLNECPYISQFYCFTHKPSPQDGEKAQSFLEFREFLEHDLEREMACRLRDKDVFDEEDVWRVTQQLVSAFAKLQSCGVTHNHICPKSIFVTKEEKVNAKINWGNFHKSTYDEVLNGKLLLTPKCYLSPELLDATKRKNKNPKYNPVQSDVFSLGMTIISICTLGDIDDLYNMKDRIVVTQKLKSKLNWIKHIFSERLYFVLNKMLKIEASKRSDFTALVDIMNMINKGDVPPSEPSSPYSRGLSRSNTGSPTNWRSSSVGRRTVTGFEVQKMRSTLSRSRASSPTSVGRKTERSTGTFGRSTSPQRSPKKVNLILQSKILTQRTEATVSSLFDKKTSPLLKEGFVPSEMLLKELEKKLLIDPLLNVLKTGMVVKYYADGSRYEGNMKGKIRDRIGINYYANGDAYAGEWKNDKFHGRGVYFFANGERYEGELANGHKNGAGVFYYANKSTYTGSWKNDKKHGKGEFKYADTKDKYEGDWEEGDRHGEGTFTYASGDVYFGGWERDEKSGKGVLKYVSGAVYEGEWAYNHPNGYGVRLYANGDHYDGHWVEGMKAGPGVYVYADGSRYDGQWDNDEKHGTGLLEHSTGDKYEGEFKDGLKHGQGVYCYENGGVYHGNWENDMKSGYGSMVLSDGTTYEGEWVAGERCGKGTVKHASGDIYGGEFRKDMMHGFGVYKWRNGDMYEGQWLNNKMHGKGKYFRRNGDHFCGIWDSQKLVKVTTIADDE